MLCLATRQELKCFRKTGWKPDALPGDTAGARALRRGGQPAHLRICEGASMEVTLSDEQPGQIMSRNRYFVLQRSQKAGFWQDFSEMYSRTAIFGKIDLLCTHSGGKRCRRVHLANISPESRVFPALEYKIRRSCHPHCSLAFARGDPDPQGAEEQINLGADSKLPPS